MAMTSAERQRRYIERLKAVSAMKVCPHCGKPLAAPSKRGRPAAPKVRPVANEAAKPKAAKSRAAR